MKNGLTLIFLLIFSSQVYGEYRVYQYYVRPKIKNVKIIESELVTSTLNPIAYLAYHGGGETLEVNLLRSWQCMGDTSKLPVCTISEGKELSESPVPIPATGVKQ